MRICIAGSKSLDMDISPYIPDGVTELVTGGVQGIDKAANLWADERHIPKLVFHLHPGITLSKLNEMILDSVDLVIVLWDGKSRGTRRILQYIRKHNIPCHLYIFISDYPGDPSTIALRAEFM